MEIYQGDDKCAQKLKSEFSTVPIPHDNLKTQYSTNTQSELM